MVINDKEEVESLRQQLKAVTAERDRLLAENRRLRREPVKPYNPAPINPPESVSAARSSSRTITKVSTATLANNDSPLPEKVKLFRSLFRGREDMFASSYWSRTIGKLGYRPACRHEWNRVLCQKPKVKLLQT